MDLIKKNTRHTNKWEGYVTAKFTLNHDNKKYKTLITASKYHIFKLYLMLSLIDT